MANETDVYPSVSTFELSITIAFFVVLSCGIIVGNGMIFAAYSLNRQLRTTTNKLILSLATSDLLVGLVSVPLWVYITFKATSQQSYNVVLYRFYIAFDIFVGVASILQLTSISIERCHAIVQPFQHRNISKMTFRMLIACPWLSACTMAALHPIQYDRWQNVYTLLMVIACFLVPFIIISLAYIFIYSFTRNKHRRLIRNTLRRRALRRELRLSVTLALITFLFVIAWLPLFTMTIVATFFPSSLPALATTDRLLKFAKWMHYSNSTINPFLYAFRNNAMKRTFKAIVKNVRCRRRVFTRQGARNVGLETLPLRSSISRSHEYYCRYRWQLKHKI